MFGGVELYVADPTDFEAVFCALCGSDTGRSEQFRQDHEVEGVNLEARDRADDETYPRRARGRNLQAMTSS